MGGAALQDDYDSAISKVLDAAESYLAWQEYQQDQKEVGGAKPRQLATFSGRASPKTAGPLSISTDFQDCLRTLLTISSQGR